MKKLFLVAMCLSLTMLTAISACRKKEDPKPDNGTPPITDTAQGAGMIDLTFSHVVDGAALNLHSDWYQNEHGDSFQVTKLSYYLSNIRLHRKDGTAYTVPESYFLLQQEDPTSLNVSLEDIPNATYTAVSFLIGVDSVRNVSGAQTGALDPIHGMFWDWDTGYIMAKFEANSPQSTRDGKIIYHVGGFSGAFNPLKTVTLPLPQDVIMSDNFGIIELEADVATWFKAVHLIDFAEVSTIHMPNANSRKVADNYAHMFRVTGATYSIE